MSWVYKGKEVSSIEDILKYKKDAIGFVYLVSFSNGRKYIGKKNLFFTRKKKFGKKELAALTDKRKKKYKMVTKESDWKYYFGSSKQVKEDVKNGVEIIKKEILNIASTKQELTYLETKELFSNAVLERQEFYNDNILGKFFNNYE